MGTLNDTWAKHNYISLRAMREWMVLIREITLRLEHMGITEASGAHRLPLSELELPTVVKVSTARCMCYFASRLPRQLFI